MNTLFGTTLLYNDRVLSSSLVIYRISPNRLLTDYSSRTVCNPIMGTDCGICDLLREN